MCSRPKEVEQLEHVPRTAESINTTNPGSKVICSFLNCSVIRERRCVPISEARFVILPPIRTSHEVGEATNVPSNIEEPPFPNHIPFNFLPFSFLLLSRFLNSPSI
jgi:hypothetical protein